MKKTKLQKDTAWGSYKVFNDVYVILTARGKIKKVFRSENTANMHRNTTDKVIKTNFHWCPTDGMYTPQGWYCSTCNGGE
jgi:hypothetical protein